MKLSIIIKRIVTNIQMIVMDVWWRDVFMMQTMYYLKDARSRVLGKKQFFHQNMPNFFKMDKSVRTHSTFVEKKKIALK